MEFAGRKSPWGAALVAGLLCALWMSPVVAVPPLIRSDDHPFDRDWPHVQIMLANKCGSCHRAGTERTDFTTYETLMASKLGQQAAVVPGDLRSSLIWEYVAWNAAAKADTNLPDHPEMPPEKKEWLSDGQLNTLARWIRNGARRFRGSPTLTRRLIETDFPSARQCAGCHPKQYSEWSRSMHAYAQQSPVFEAFNLTMVERTNGTIGTFCSRCHTPVGTALGENASVRNVHRSRISREGITCITCHRRPKPHYKASGRLAITPGKLTDQCMYGPFESSASDKAGSHPSRSSAYIRTSQFCAECHDVTSPQGVRLEEAFSEWHNSPAARKGITCQQCHMGPVQGVAIPEDHRPLGRAAVVPGVPAEMLPLRRLSDHTFAGPDYSMLPDSEFPHKLDWMYETDYRDRSKLDPYKQVTLDELRRANRRSLKVAASKRYELLHNAARIEVLHPKMIRAGDRTKVRVAVVSKTMGHSFPTGFTAERQAWVFIQLRDAKGRVVFSSGDLDSNGDLRDDHSHAVLTRKVPYDRHLFNMQNKFIALTYKGTERSVVLPVNRDLLPISIVRPAATPAASFGRPPVFRIAKSSLPPLGRREQTYPIRVPANNDSPYYFLEVRLNFRHLPPTLLDSLGIANLKSLLEVVTIDGYQATIPTTAGRK